MHQEYMSKKTYSIITGTGSYLPTEHIANTAFHHHQFYDENGELLNKPTSEIVDKFSDITTITERRYTTDAFLTSDLGFFAAEKAILSAGINKEELDYIIFASNFGDIRPNHHSTEYVPSLASKVKHQLGITNPYTVAYDLIFGCPGWLQAVIQADYFIKSGDAKKILIIGAETLSRVIDPHDRDSMLFSDGAGAVIVEAKESDTPIGILGHLTRSDTLSHNSILQMNPSYNSAYSNNELFVKMNGRRVFQYALEKVPPTIKDCLEKCKIDIRDIKKILIHQANGKMDEAIVARLFGLYNIEIVPENIMPLTVSILGNSSVATLPTLLDLILTNQLKPHTLCSNDLVVFASIGAGMNINTIVYKMI